MNGEGFDSLLKVLELYKLKQVPRNSSNHYYDTKDEVAYRRRETTAEHVYSALRLADYFLTVEPEFASVDRLRVYELNMSHDDAEIIIGDVGVSELEKRASKKEEELAAFPMLASRLPHGLDAKLLICYHEYRRGETPEARFAHAVDKMDAMLHELPYPQDWGPKGFDEANVRAWFEPAFAFSPTFTAYFELMVDHLRTNKYFEK